MPDKNYEQLIEEIRKMGYLKSQRLIDAFLKFERKFFVPTTMSSFANSNRPLPIGSGQTISQPLTVAFMLELLNVQKGNQILEIGAGSGWQTAILSDLVGNNGKIYAYEIVKSLCTFGKKNLSRYNLRNVDYECKDVSEGDPENAPYDRIISAAAFIEIPDIIKTQLKEKGILVAPTKENDIRKIKRVSEQEFEEEIYPGFVFVPITKGIKSEE